MGDFLVELHDELGRGSAPSLGSSLRSQCLESEALRFSVSYNEPADIWAPFRAENGSIYAIAGMCVFEEEIWEAARSVPGQGGLAGKAICHLFESGGLKKLEGISGNCALVVYDSVRRTLHLICDPAGAFPVFKSDARRGICFGSHPDIVARAAGVEQEYDDLSLAEFVISSTVSPPFTFYRKVRAVPYGSTLTVDVETRASRSRSNFSLLFQEEKGITEEELAEDLADALRGAVRKRTTERFGLPVVALSGGLDSRLLLSCMEDPSRALTFTCYDRPNRELKIAEDVASAVGARFLPLRRSPEFYAENAKEGVRISGGMGTFANNHFLGVMDQLRSEGMGVLLTGCYFDYLFKGLPLNRYRHWLTGRERLAPFEFDFYFGHNFPSTALSEQVRERWLSRFPTGLQKQTDDESLFELEVRRTFPLCYEGDNQQRVVPQRISPWFPPVVDRNVLDVYRRIPSRMKLNRSIFLRAARRLLAGSPVGRIPDANTGVSLEASSMLRWMSVSGHRIRRKCRLGRRTLASDGSWPDWQYYVTHSQYLEELWRQPQSEADDLFRRVMGWKRIPETPSEFGGNQLFLFVSMLTLKLWFLQRQH